MAYKSANVLQRNKFVTIPRKFPANLEKFLKKWLSIEVARI